MSRRNSNGKPKLPRRRKKACIKAQGRASYYSTVALAKVTGEANPKFWVNASVRYAPYQTKDGGVVVIPTPQRYW